MTSTAVPTESVALRERAALAITNAEFRSVWPIEVRRSLVRAAQTEWEFPEYAVKETKWALAEARRIEQKCSRDIEQGERNLSQSDRRRLGAK